MGRPRGHVRKLTGDRWRLYAEAAPDPFTGVRRQATTVAHAPNRRAALDLLAAHVADVAAGRWDRGTSGKTVDQALDVFLEHHTAGANTMHEWNGALARYIRPHVGTLLVDELTTQQLDQLYRQLVTGGGRAGRPLTASTVRKAHVPLRLALELVRRWGWIRTNPAADASPPAVVRVAIAPPADADVAKLIALAEETDPDWACAIRLLAHTGMRRGELCALKWSDVDLDTGELSVQRVVKVVGQDAVIADYAKTSSSTRRIGLGPLIVQQLLAARARQRERALAAGARTRDAYLFSDDVAGRTPWHPKMLTTRFARLRKRAGLDTRAHDLRHYMATRWIADGEDVRTVAGRGGWANATTLLTTYAAWVPARDRAAASRLDDVG